MRPAPLATALVGGLAVVAAAVFLLWPDQRPATPIERPGLAPSPRTTPPAAPVMQGVEPLQPVVLSSPPTSAAALDPTAHLDAVIARWRESRATAPALPAEARAKDLVARDLAREGAAPGDAVLPVVEARLVVADAALGTFLVDVAAEVGTPAAADLLLRLARGHGEAQIRRAAARALARAKGAGAGVLLALAEAEQDRGVRLDIIRLAATVARQAETRLPSSPPASAAEDLAALGRAASRDPHKTRDAATVILDAGGEIGRRVVEDLARTHPDPAVRAGVAAALGALEDEWAAAVLQALLAPAEPVEVRRAAIAALGRVGTKGALAALAEAETQDQDPTLRRMAAGVLRVAEGQGTQRPLGDPGVVPVKPRRDD